MSHLFKIDIQKEESRKFKGANGLRIDSVEMFATLTQTHSWEIRPRRAGDKSARNSCTSIFEEDGTPTEQKFANRKEKGDEEICVGIEQSFFVNSEPAERPVVH